MHMPIPWFVGVAFVWLRQYDLHLTFIKDRSIHLLFFNHVVLYVQLEFYHITAGIKNCMNFKERTLTCSVQVALAQPHGSNKSS